MVYSLILFVPAGMIPTLPEEGSVVVNTGTSTRQRHK